MIPDETHQPVLFEIIRRTKNGILELGAGDCSTRQIHDIAVGRKILTIDHLQFWIDRYKDLELDTHKFLTIDNDYILNFYMADTEPWSVVFVDSILWEVRVPAINKYKDTAEYVVVHDAQRGADMKRWGRVIRPLTETDIGLRDFSDSFKYWIEFIPINWNITYPTTVIGSNKYDLKDFNIDNMIKLNSNGMSV